MHFAGTRVQEPESGDGGPASAASIGSASQIAVDDLGNVYLLDAPALSVRKIDTAGVISTLFTSPAFALDKYTIPLGLAVDSSGTIYADGEASQYDLSTPFNIYTFTQDGTLLNSYPLESQNGGTSSYPWAIDASGNLYWLDSGVNLNKRTADGITTITALPQIPKYDDYLRMTVDPSGNVFISNISGGYYSQMTQEVTPDRHIFTVAQEGTFLANDLGYGHSLATDAAGNLYAADPYDWRIRELTAGCPVVAQPLISAAAVVNAASYDQTLAAGELAAMFGLNIGPAAGQVVPVTSGFFPTEYAGVSITVNNYPAPLLYVSQTQDNFVVPIEIEGQLLRFIEITYDGVTSDQYFTGIDGEADPGIFVIANPDASANSATNPVTAGSYVVIYGTGQGVSNVAQADGIIMGYDLALPALPMTATIDGSTATVLYAGSAPGLVAGILQLNLSVPAQLSPGQHKVIVSAGEWSNSSQAYSLFTQ